MKEIFVQIIVAALAGGIAGWFSPLIQWQVEKRRMRMARRQALIDSWRTNLLPKIPEQSSLYLGDDDAAHDFIKHPDFASLRPQLPDGFFKSFNGRTVYVGSPDHLRQKFIVEIGKIERKWGLV